MKIAKVCIQHKVATLLAVIMVVIFGIMFGTRLQMALMPNMEMPMAVVMTTYAGATPTDIEELVTSPLESAIMSVSGVDEIKSTSSQNVSTIQITYVDGTDLDIAATKLREQFDRVSLPDDASDPMIININISELMPTAMIALTGEDLSQLQTTAEDVISPALERIDGVAQVSVSGGLESQISVEIDQAKAAGFGLTNSYISQFLAGQNLLYPGGNLQNGSKKLTVSTDAKFQSVEDVANTLIALPTGGTVRLSEVADVRLDHDDPDAVAKVGTLPCVLLQVSKQSGANEMEVSRAVTAKLAELQADHASIQYTIPYIASDYIQESVDNAFSNIWQGILLAAIVVFLYLRRGGPTLTICISMPVCILSVFVLMNALDLTLNMMSLGGIAMGVGMIVDNSIVVLENINRFAAEGHDRMSACVDGTQEVTSSVVASTLTTLAVFVPLGMVSGMAGDMFRDFSLTIASLIAASLIISLTLVPLLCYFTLDEEKVRRQRLKKEAKAASAKRSGGAAAFFGNLFGRMNQVYLRLLNYFIHHLKAGMLAALAMVVLFTVTLANTKMVLTPEMDQNQISISISMPTGSSVDEASAIADRVAAIVEKECPETDELYYIASGGSSMSMMMSSNSVTMGVNLIDKQDRTRSAFEIEDALRDALQDIAGCEITVSASNSMSSMSGSDIDVEISGDDYDTLEMIAGDLKSQIAALPDAINVESSLSEEVPQVKVIMKREAASQYGLTAAAVGAAVRSELTGSTATTVTIDNKEYDVVVKGSGAASASLDALKSMPVSSGYGGTIPLSAVADVVVEQAPQSVVRHNQSRQVSITGDTISGDTSAMTKQINAILDGYSLPQGYTAESGGAYSDMMDSFGDLLFALAVALLLVYFVLAVQFESFAMPAIVMLILPVAFSGALFALPLTGRDLSIIALVSIIMLAGTVVNSSIILVEYIKIRRGMGESREEAILHACPLRIRPIMMTTLTTVIAMIPMAMGIGGTNEMMSDMGITMISGMSISTVVTLVLTPVFYSVIDDLSHRRKKKRAPAVPAGNGT